MAAPATASATAGAAATAPVQQEAPAKKRAPSAQTLRVASLEAEVERLNAEVVALKELFARVSLLETQVERGVVFGQEAGAQREHHQTPLRYINWCDEWNPATTIDGEEFAQTLVTCCTENNLLTRCRAPP